MTLEETSTRTYQIYGRKSYPDPLSLVGRVQIGDESALKDEVFGQFGGSGWVELVAFPAEAAIQVVPREAAR